MQKSTTKIGHVNYSTGSIVIDSMRINSLFDPRFEFKIIPASNDVIPLEEAAKAYEMITTNVNREKYIGVLLQYPKREEKWATVITKKTK